MLSGHPGHEPLKEVFQGSFNAHIRYQTDAGNGVILNCVTQNSHTNFLKDPSISHHPYMCVCRSQG